MPMNAAKLLLLNVLGGGGAWETVLPPDGAFTYLPFDVQKMGVQYRAEPSFDLRAHAAISVAKTYYLNTVSGSDAANGTTPATPKKTWNAIIGMGDYDRIIIQDGSYLVRSSSSLAPSRSLEVIGEGTVYFTSDRSAQLGAWSLTSGQTYTYQATTSSEYISRVFDEGTLNGYGNPTPYTSKASIAEVESTAGSYYWVGGTLYVHTLDGLTPSGRTDLKYYDSSAIYWSKDNLTFYFENVNFRGGAAVRNASATGGTNVYLNNCTGHYFTVAGVSEFIMQDSTLFTALADAMNYDTLNTVVTNAVEINCEFYDGGTSPVDQASTSHNACPVVRIMGTYHHVTGQCVADVGGVKTWVLGSELHNSGSGVGYLSYGEAWLDGVYIHDNAVDMETSSGFTIHKRGLRSGGNFVLGGGTIVDY